MHRYLGRCEIRTTVPVITYLTGVKKSIPFDFKRAALFVAIILTDLPRELGNEIVSQKIMVS